MRQKSQEDTVADDRDHANGWSEKGMRDAEKGELAVARRYVEKCVEDGPVNGEYRYLVRYSVIREGQRTNPHGEKAVSCRPDEGRFGTVPGMDTEYQEKEHSAYGEGRSDNPDPGCTNRGIFMKNHQFIGCNVLFEKEIEPAGEDRFALSHLKHGEENNEHIAISGMADRDPSGNRSGAIRYRNRDEAEYVLPGHEWRDEDG